MNAPNRGPRVRVAASSFDQDPRDRLWADEILSAIALMATLVILTWLLWEVGGFPS